MAKKPKTAAWTFWFSGGVDFCLCLDGLELGLEGFFDDATTRKIINKSLLFFIVLGTSRAELKERVQCVDLVAE